MTCSAIFRSGVFSTCLLYAACVSPAFFEVRAQQQPLTTFEHMQGQWTSIEDNANVAFRIDDHGRVSSFAGTLSGTLGVGAFKGGANYSINTQAGTCFYDVHFYDQGDKAHWFLTSSTPISGYELHCPHGNFARETQDGSGAPDGVRLQANSLIGSWVGGFTRQPTFGYPSPDTRLCDMDETWSVTLDFVQFDKSKGVMIGKATKSITRTSDQKTCNRDFGDNITIHGDIFATNSSGSEYNVENITDDGRIYEKFEILQNGTIDYKMRTDVKDQTIRVRLSRR